MSPLNGTGEKTVHELLERTVRKVRLVEPRRWRLRFASNGAEHSGDAWIEEDWLVLDAPLEPNGRPKAWDLVRRNARLDGLGKFALLANGESPRLLAEVPLDEEVDLTSVVKPTLDGFAEGLARRVSQRHQRETGTSREAANTPAEPSVAPTWQAERRGDGALTVPLHTVRGLFHAKVAGAGDHGLRVRVALSACDSLAPSGRRALALFLLRVSGAIRHARAAIDEDEGRLTACLEVRVSDSRNAAEMDHALSALSVACDLCGQEAPVMQEPTIAERYLNVHG